jgi:hypothetical protein
LARSWTQYRASASSGKDSGLAASGSFRCLPFYRLIVDHFAMNSEPRNAEHLSIEDRLREIYPELTTPEEIAEARESLTRYGQIILRIFLRLQQAEQNDDFVKTDGHDRIQQ